MATLGIIPARGGSKGIPGKNLARVGERTMLGHAIEAGRNSGVLDRLVVDSDDDRILDEARSCGAEVLYKRPAHLADDTSKTASVVEHLLDHLERAEAYRPETLVLLEPTCPLRTAEDVTQAFRTFAESSRPCLLTVSEPMQHPNDFIRREGSGWAYWSDRSPSARGRQDFGEAWFINGGIYITKTDFFRATGKFYDLSQAAVSVMAASHSFDVDTPFDLALVRAYVAFADSRES